MPLGGRETSIGQRPQIRHSTCIEKREIFMTRLIAITLFALSPTLAAATGTGAEIGTALVTLTEAEITTATLAEAARTCGDATWLATAEMNADGMILANTVEVSCHG